MQLHCRVCNEDQMDEGETRARNIIFLRSRIRQSYSHPPVPLSLIIAPCKAAEHVDETTIHSRAFIHRD